MLHRIAVVVLCVILLGSATILASADKFLNNKPKPDHHHPKKAPTTPHDGTVEKD